MPSLAFPAWLLVSLFVGEARSERPALLLSAAGAGASKTYEKLLFCRWGGRVPTFCWGRPRD